MNFGPVEEYWSNIPQSRVYLEGHWGQCFVYGVHTTGPFPLSVPLCAFSFRSCFLDSIFILHENCIPAVALWYAKGWSGS